MSELAAVSGVVLAGMTAVYLYAWDLFRRRFFVFMAFAWWSNAIYLYAELWVVRTRLTDDLAATAMITAGCAVTALFLWAAINDLGILPYAHRTTIVIAIVGAIAVPSGLAVAPILPIATVRLELMTSGVAVVTAAALFTLARYVWRRPSAALLEILRKRRPDADVLLSNTNASVTTNVAIDSFYGSVSSPLTLAAQRSLRAAKVAFSLSCLVYGFLQLLYPLRKVINALDPKYFVALFWLSLIAKLLHGSVVPSLLLAQFRTTAEALRTRSVAEELGVLTASIEHDIRSPLAVIVKELETIRLRYQADRWLTRKLAIIEDETTRINTAASVIPATRELVEHFNEHADVVNLVHLVRDAIAAVKKVDRVGDLRITFATSRSEMLVRADAARLKQAFVNILNNGVEACRARDDKRPPLIEVGIRLSSNRQACVVDITDHGIGITKEAAKQIGRPMFSTKSGHKGNRGIGLFIATRAFRLHGGDIRLESDGSRLTCATITIPCIDDHFVKGGKQLDGSASVASVQ